MNPFVRFRSCVLSSLAVLGLAAADEPDAMWTYKVVDGKELKMSVFLPEDYETGGSFPAMVWFHGGSWRSGEANWHYPDCEYWAGRGMVAVSVDYRLKDRDGVEVPLECVKDAKAAVIHLRKHAGKLKIDADRIVVAGGSAGGQLAAATAMIRGAETYDDPTKAVSCVPNAIILTNPWFKCQANLSPPEHVRDGLPPTITFIGDSDAGITVESLRAYDKALRAAGNASELYVGEGGKHGFCNGRNPKNPYFYWSLELSDRFLVKHGILSGESRVVVPEGVEKLETAASSSR
ncbi:MAG: alpha/beta hydrolase [Haloferula sp.]